MAQQLQNPFQSPYVFKANKEIVIQHPHGAHIRILPNNPDFADGNGGQGKFARWKVELEQNGHCRIQNSHTGKYLRIWQRGEKIDVNGGGGPFTLFKIHHKQINSNIVRLESERFNGKFVAVNLQKQLVVGAGGPHCIFTCFKEGGIIQQQHQHQHQHHQQQEFHNEQKIGGGGDLGEFSAMYGFGGSDLTIVIRSLKFGKHLRVDPQNEGLADGNGGVGGFAQWKVKLHKNDTCQLESLKTGKYLRIHEGGEKLDVGGVGGPFTYFRFVKKYGKPNIVTLESTKFDKKYVAITDKNGATVGFGGPWCELEFYRKPGQQQQQQQQQHNKQPFTNTYMFKKSGVTVVLENPHDSNKHVRVNPNNVGDADGEGGLGGFAHWKVILHNNGLCQLQSLKSNKYLRIFEEKKIDVNGVGGPFTYFHHNFVPNTNHKVTFQSQRFPKSYVAVNKDDFKLVCGFGGPWCHIRVKRD